MDQGSTPDSAAIKSVRAPGREEPTPDNPPYRANQAPEQTPELDVHRETSAPTDHEARLIALVLNGLNSEHSNAREEAYRQSEHVPTVRDWYQNQRNWDRFLGPSSREALFARKQKELEEIIRPAIYRASFELLRLAAHCKEGKYVDEDEWRLSLPHKAGKAFKHNELQFRGPQNIPFVAHNLFNFGLPVTEIMLGANCTALTRTRTLLKTRGLDIPITSSQLPW